MRAFALDRGTVISRIFAGRTRCFERKQTYHTLRVWDIPLPSSNREPAVDLHLHISMSLEEESVLQLALASEAEADYIPGLSPEKHLFRGVSLNLKSPAYSRKKQNWSFMPTAVPDSQSKPFLRKSNTHLQPTLNLPAKLRAVRSKRYLDPLPAISHNHTCSDLTQSSKGLLDRSIRENRPNLLDNHFHKINVRLKKKGGKEFVMPELLRGFPNFFGNGTESSPRQILAVRKAQYM